MISLTPSPQKNTIIETLVEFGVSIPPQLAIKRWLIVIGRLVSWLIIYIYIYYMILTYIDMFLVVFAGFLLRGPCSSTS